MEDVEDPVRARLDRRAESARRRYLNAKGYRSSTHMGRRMVLLLLRRLFANSHDEEAAKRAEIVNLMDERVRVECTRYQSYAPAH